MYCTCWKGHQRKLRVSIYIKTKQGKKQTTKTTGNHAKKSHSLVPIYAKKSICAGIQTGTELSSQYNTFNLITNSSQ